MVTADVTDAWRRYATTLGGTMIVTPFAEIVRRNELRLLGIAGPPGSGKSSFARAVAASLDDAAVVSTDDYYLSKAERGTAFRSAHDLPALIATLDRIRSGRAPLTVQRFSGEIDDRIAPVTFDTVPSHVLLEGFVLGNRADGYNEILERLDLLVFLEVDEATARERRFAREAELRKRGGGFSEEEMQRFWDEILAPGMARWMDDARAWAGLVIEPDESGGVRSVHTSSAAVLAALDGR